MLMDPGEFGAGTGAVGLHSNQAQKVPGKGFCRKRDLRVLLSGGSAWALSDFRAMQSKSAAAFPSNLLCGVNQSQSV